MNDINILSKLFLKNENPKQKQLESSTKISERNLKLRNVPC